MSPNDFMKSYLVCSVVTLQHREYFRALINFLLLMQNIVASDNTLNAKKKKKRKKKKRKKKRKNSRKQILLYSDLALQSFITLSLKLITTVVLAILQNFELTIKHAEKKI